MERRMRSRGDTGQGASRAAHLCHQSRAGAEGSPGAGAAGSGASAGPCGPAIRSLCGSRRLGGTWVVEASLFCRGEDRAAGPSGQRRWRVQLSKVAAGRHSWAPMGAIHQNHFHPRVEEEVLQAATMGAGGLGRECLHWVS